MNLNKLQEEITTELNSLDIIFGDIVNFPQFIENKDVNNYDKAAVALLLSQFYNGVENILKRILNFFSIKIPKSDDYHIEIINNFKIGHNNLPIIFTDENIEGFTILRRFRHYVFYGYSFTLDWDRLKLAIILLPKIYNSFKNNLFIFLEEQRKTTKENI